MRIESAALFKEFLCHLRIALAAGQMQEIGSELSFPFVTIRHLRQSSAVVTEVRINTMIQQSN
jgi:hypothetical protein